MAATVVDSEGLYVPSGVTLARRGTVVGGVVSADVARLDLHLDDGSVRYVTPTDGPAYTGRYAGHVRFALADVGARRVHRVVAFGADGRRLAGGLVFSGQGRLGRIRGTRLEAIGFGGPDDRPGRDPHCVAAPGAPLAAALACVSGGTSVHGYASCATHRLLVYGVLRHGAPVRVQRAGGGSVRARLVHVPRTFVLSRGPHDDPVAWSVRLPPSAGVTGVRIGTRRIPLRLPPGAAQCGYVRSGALL